MTDNGALTAPKRRAITALLTERDVRSAARAAGVSERSLWRWMEGDTFRAELARQESAIVEQITRGLLSMQSAALKELSELINGAGGVPPGVRLQAVKTALEILMKYRELYNLEERISKLEAKNDNLR